MEVTTVGLDLGKDVFQVPGITADSTVAFNRTIRRKQLLKFLERLPSCLVGIEAYRPPAPEAITPMDQRPIMH